MDLVAPLRPGLAAALEHEQTLALARARGETPTGTWAALAAEHPVLFDAERLASLRKAIDEAPPEATDARGVAESLATYLVHAHTHRTLEGFERELAARDSAPVLEVNDARRSLAEALATVARAVDGAERDALESAIDRTLRERSQPEAHRIEALQRLALHLGTGSATALHEMVGGPVNAWLAPAARQLLANTQDAYEDVLGYALGAEIGFRRKRALRGCHWHDVLKLRHGVLARVVHGAGLVSAVKGWLELWRLPGPRAESLGPSGALFLAPPRGVDAPGSPWRPDDGHEASTRLFASLADLQRSLHARRDDPVEARGLAAPVVVQAHRALFAGLLLEPEFLRRFLGVPRENAVDAARILALVALSRLREDAALSLYQHALDEAGPVPGLQDAFAETMGRALGVSVPRGLWLWKAEPELAPARRVAGAAWAEALRGSLRERFDQDWFRNPGASAWLARRWARGARESSGTLGQAIGLTEPPGLERLAKAWVAVLNA